MTEDATETLEPFRKYLKVLAELHLDRKLRGKLDASDVVQQTMMRAYSAMAEVRDPQRHSASPPKETMPVRVRSSERRWIRRFLRVR